MAAIAFRPSEPVDDLLHRLHRALPAFAVEELEGYVFVEHSRLPRARVCAALRAALPAVLGPLWRRLVDGLDGE